MFNRNINQTMWVSENFLIVTLKKGKDKQMKFILRTFNPLCLKYYHSINIKHLMKCITFFYSC